MEVSHNEFSSYLAAHPPVRVYFSGDGEVLSASGFWRISAPGSRYQNTKVGVFEAPENREYTLGFSFSI